MFSLLSKLLSLKLLDNASMKAERLLLQTEESLSKLIVMFVAMYAAGIFFIIGTLILLAALFMYLFEFYPGVTPALWTGAVSLVISIILFFVAKGKMDHA